MKNNAVHILFFLAWLVVAASVQDAIPPLGGVKPPLVLALALYMSFRRPLLAAIAAAVFAGSFAEALDVLPFGSVTVFFAVMALAVHAVRGAVELPPPALGALATPVAAAAFEFWRRMWTPAPGAAGALAAAIPALAAGAFLFALLTRAERFAGIGPEADALRGGGR